MSRFIEFAFSIPIDARIALEKKAKEYEVSMSTFIRMLITDDMKKRGEINDGKQ
jgi:hypothetical protein